MTTNAGGLRTPAPLLTRWREASTSSVWLRPADWHDGPVDAVVCAYLVGAGLHDAVERLGRSRGEAGIGVAETIDDLACLWRADERDGDPPLDVVRALCQGWADGQAGALVAPATIDPESGLPTTQYLTTRLAEAYRDATRAAHAADEVDPRPGAAGSLVVVDVAVGEIGALLRSLRAAAVGDALSLTFGEGHPMASVGNGVFVALLQPDDDQELLVAELRVRIRRAVEALDVADVTRRPPRVQVLPLPGSYLAAVSLLQGLRRS